MQITIEEAPGRVPVTVMGLHGDLDASNYLAVIARARELYQSGVRNLLIDMAGLGFMGSSGIVALHSVVLIMRGEEPPDPEYGWSAHHALDHERDGDLRAHIKLLSPQPKIARSLELTGMTDVLAIYTDRQAAIESFAG